MTKQKNKTNYILNTNHVFPFEQFGKKWIMYVPGYEGIYAISEDYSICSLDRICISSAGIKINYKTKLIKPRVSRKVEDALGSIAYSLSCKNNSGNTSFTKKQLAFIVLNNEKIKNIEHTFPFNYNNKTWIGYLKDQHGNVFKDYVISDDVSVMTVNKFINANLEFKSKIRKWSLTNKCEFIIISVKDSNGVTVRKNIYRNNVVKQVSEILETMPDN